MPSDVVEHRAKHDRRHRHGFAAAWRRLFTGVYGRFAKRRLHHFGKRRTYRAGRALLGGIIGLSGVIAAGFGIWDTYTSTATRIFPPTASSPVNTSTPPTQSGLATPVAPAPRLSIIILPFTNISSDPEQEYFADGLVEDLTTELSRYEGLFVIARSTAFTFKGRAVDARQIGRELNLRYVMDGSVRRAGDQVRINARLTDAETGTQLWGSHFDGERTMIAALQNEILAQLGQQLRHQVIFAEGTRVARLSAREADAEDLALRAQATYLRGRTTVAELLAARRLFEEATQLGPRSLRAWDGVSYTTGLLLARRAIEKRSAEPILVEAAARTAAIDARSWFSRRSRRGLAYFVEQDWPRYLTMVDEDIAEFPSDADLRRSRASALLILGRPEESIRATDEAIRLSPRDPRLGTSLFQRGEALFQMQAFAEAAGWLGRAIEYNPDFVAAYPWNVAALHLAGDDAGSRQALSRMRQRHPSVTASNWFSVARSSNAIFLAAEQRVTDALRQLGLPD
jgi:TolB-like protein